MDTVLTQRIGAFLRDGASRPHRYGHNDCAMLAAGAVQIVTGRDPMEDLRGTYSSRWEYLRLAMLEGGLLAMARRRLDFLPAMIEGDGVGLFRTGDRQFFATRLNGAWLAPSEPAGLGRVQAGTLIEGWTWSRP